ncbi:insecticidal toxin complex protein TccC [Pseudomonas sp. Z003-0.4C(8344-21)]|uniref:RHS repeat domain-containing protein n=1 Tax=Pseudomonas sp. Z003-0.4C(8344-21) TaxID=1855380 RepID=UPI00087A3447|nr:RHS repeat-associated core domain-containing protein [Pseudomonas sp. Z003-0.4C(8344-21)]SDS82890.1 insecticidal toxin complex protein TccC [Pseudomonas sp. Z003-0.4C(8344-21)]
MDVHHDTATPTLSVIDSRSLMIRSVGYCRRPDSPDIDPRITRQVFDAAGRQVASWDPRLWGAAPKPNLATTYGLSGQALLTDSVDAGWQLSLPDQARSLRSSWDARDSECHRDYDNLQRPIVVTEQARSEPPRVVERLSYADADDVFAQHNQCGRLIRHDDPAGTRLIRDYGLAGAELVESRRMLADLDLPDWPGDPEHRDVFLEAQSYVTRYVFYPTGELKEQTDAMGNAQTRQYNVAGQLSATWLLPGGEGKPPTRLVSDIRYNAHEQIEHETAGNGVTTRAEYSPEDGRLLKLSAAAGEQTPLQNLHYVYDPVGNIVSLEDKTQAVTYFNHQRIEPVSRYRYDSLYQLVEAKGWEVSQPSHGPALPDLLPTPLDPKQRRNYTQTFAYDAAGNLITRHHSGAPVFSMFTSACSNRSLAQRDDGSLPGEPQISEGFDLAGNQLELQRGQAMSWDVRGLLRRVTLVRRRDEPNDEEGYVYDRPGHRLRKTCLSQTSGQTLKSEVRYLPGVEVHREANGKERHVISVEAGRNQVRMLHWPEGVEGDQLRYSLSDHLGSSTLELDDGAGILSQEHYYPFGGTACWAGKSALVAKYKTIRYSGKERDATGLYYYGYRYYASWLQRWVNPDPAWYVDGLNLFRVLRNSPVSLREYTGLSPVPPNNVTTKQEHPDQVDDFLNDLPRDAPDEMPEINTVKVNEEFLSRVSDYFQNNIDRITQLNTLLEHKPIDAVKISSGRMIFPEGHGSGGQVIKDEFINEYHPSGVWIFRGNYKESKTKQFFASDVQLVQVAYMGITDYPSMMVRNEVKNKETLAATEKFASDSIELKEAFFTTPNGKNTAQILKALDMEATSVKRSVSPHADFPSFYIAVRPKARGVLEKPNL